MITTFDELVGGETTLATLIADRLDALDIDEILKERPNLGGICFLVHDVMEELKVPDELFNLVSTRVLAGNKGYEAEHFIWFDYPHFSGNIMYPVPAPNDFELHRPAADYGTTPTLLKADLAYNKLDRWTGEYGRKRLNALEWLIEHLRINPHCFSVRERV